MTTYSILRTTESIDLGLEHGIIPLDWEDDALCAQTDPEAFFPEKGGSTRDAKKICGSCEVRTRCLEYALEHNQQFGIWGGLSERERRKLRKAAPITTVPDSAAEARRRAVAEMTAQGFSLESIADSLEITKRHVSRIRATLGIRVIQKRDAA